MSISLLLPASSAQAAPIATGWSNGNQPPEALRKFGIPLCPNNSYIDSWIVGEGDVASSVGLLLSIVSIQARCSDGSLLPPIEGSTPVSAKHNASSTPELSSSSGYSCSKLHGYNNGGNWIMNFLGVGQQLAQDDAGRPLKFDCSKVPPAYVAVGYSGYTGFAVDAINVMMAAPPTGNGTASFSPAPTATTAAASPASEESPAKLSTGAIVGIVTSSLVGLSAIVAIAYNLWKWVNKHRLVAAKHLPQGRAAEQLPKFVEPQQQRKGSSWLCVP
jgi:hypothetical protein